MPLKDIDVKTFESYKKAIHQDVTKISDTSKVKFWVYKDIELPDATGKKQKIPGFIALVDDAGVRNFLRGKKLMCTGICRLEHGKVQFEPVKGAVPYAQLKKTVPLFLGKQLYIPTGAKEDEESESIEDDREETPLQNHTEHPDPKLEHRDPQLEHPDPQLAAAWAKLEQQVHSAMAAFPDRKQALQQAAAHIAELIKANKGPEATKSMEALREQLTASLAKQPDSSPTKQLDSSVLTAEWGKLVPRIKAAGDPALLQAAADAGKHLGDLVKQGKLDEAQTLIDQLTARLDQLKTKPPETSKLDPKDIVAAWQKLAPQIDKKAKVHPEVKEAALRARKQAEELTKAGRLDAAKHILEELAKYLAGVGEESSETETEDTGRTAPEDPRRKQYEQRWTRLEKEVQRVLQAKLGDASRIRTAVALAGERAEGGDLASALKVLDGLQDLLSVAETEDVAPIPGLVEYRKKLHTFQTARAKVERQIEQLSSAISKLLPEEEDFADSLSEELDDELEEVQDLIDDAINASNDDREPADKALQGRIQESAKALESSQLVQEAETNPFGVPVEIRKILVTALSEISGSMPLTA